MKIGGYRKISLIDYPGKISSVIFTVGCRFSCPYCHNPELVKPPKNMRYYPQTEIFEDLEKRSKFIQGIVISGGEPTEQKNIIPFLQSLRKFNLPIKLDTNGSNPKILLEILENNLVEYVAMDLKTDPFFYNIALENLTLIDCHLINASIKIIMTYAPDHEFRTTCIKGYISSLKMIDNIARYIKGAKLYVLQPFKDSGNLLNKKFTDTTTIEEIKQYKQIANKYVKTIIRN